MIEPREAAAHLAADLDHEDEMDSDLVARAQRGDEKALTAILLKYSPATRSKAKRFFMQGAESDDLVQEAMIGLFQAVRDFDPSRCAKFRVFAVLCINRQIMTAVKLAARYKHSPLNHAHPLDDVWHGDITTSRSPLGRDDPATLTAANDHIEVLSQVINELSALEAAALSLYVQGRSYKEIANHLGSRPKVIDNAIQRVRTKVKRRLRHRGLWEIEGGAATRELAYS